MAVHRVPVYCYQCVAGPDLLNVVVQDGVATRIEPNFACAMQHPAGGRVCVKAYGLWVQVVRRSGKRPEDYPLWLLTSRSMQYAWGANVSLPIMADVARTWSG